MKIETQKIVDTNLEYFQDSQYVYVVSEDKFKTIKNQGEIVYMQITYYDDVSFQGNAVIRINSKFKELYFLLLTLKRSNESIYMFNSKFHVFLSSSSSIENLRKYRGDFAELSFIYQYGGIKKYDLSSNSDVVVGGISYEIKSFSSTKNQIIVSSKQLLSSSKIVAMELIEDDKGWDIFRLATEIKKSNPQPAIDEIVSKYNEMYKMIKFKIIKGKLFKKPSNYKKEDFYTSAKFSISLSNKLTNYLN